MSMNWFKGPDWIISKENWPTQPEVTETDENTLEKITSKEHLGLVTTEQEENRVEPMVHKLSY